MEGGTIIIDAASPKLNRWKWFRIKSLVTQDFMPMEKHLGLQAVAPEYLY